SVTVPEALRKKTPNGSGVGAKLGAPAQVVIPLSAPSTVRPSIVTPPTPSTTMTVASALPVVRLVALATMPDRFTTAPPSPRNVSGLAMVNCSAYTPGQTFTTSCGRAAAMAAPMLVYGLGVGASQLLAPP